MLSFIKLKQQDEKMNFKEVKNPTKEEVKGCLSSSEDDYIIFYCKYSYLQKCLVWVILTSKIAIKIKNMKITLKVASYIF